MLTFCYDTQIETNPHHLPRNPEMKNTVGLGKAFIHSSHLETLNSRPISNMLKIICLNSSLKMFPHSLMQQEARKFPERKAHRNLIFTLHVSPRWDLTQRDARLKENQVNPLLCQLTYRTQDDTEIRGLSGEFCLLQNWRHICRHLSRDFGAFRNNPL